MYTESFMGLKGGDRIRFLVYAGMGRNGAEYREKVGRVARYLTFDTHVIVNSGGRHGTPILVDARNYLGRA